MKIKKSKTTTTENKQKKTLKSEEEKTHTMVKMWKIMKTVNKTMLLWGGVNRVKKL